MREIRGKDPATIAVSVAAATLVLFERDAAEARTRVAQRNAP
jgi:xanthine/CO dehydrogenase XdhC/CoxF family maturation factor